MTDTGFGPLAVVQEGVWARSVLSPDQVPYNEVACIRKRGSLDAEALRRSLQRLVQRHEAWRTTYRSSADQFKRVVHDTGQMQCPAMDFSDLPAESAERRAVEAVAGLARVPFDLSAGPLMRARLIRVNPADHRLYLVMHHLIFDAVSISRVILPELVALYEAEAGGVDAVLAEVDHPYSAYAAWQQDWVEGPRATRRFDYWAERLRDLPCSLLPSDRPRTEAWTARGGCVSVDLDASSIERARAWGAARNLSLFQVMAAAWAVLLGRFSGRTEAVFASAADARQRPEFERTVGYCVTPVLLRVDLSGDPPFADVAKRVRDELLDGVDHLVALDRLIQHLPPQEDTSRPGYQTMLVMEPDCSTPDDDWSVRYTDGPLGDAVGVCRLDMELQLEPAADGGLAGRLLYDRSLFDADTASRIASYWAGLVRQSVNGAPAPEDRADPQITQWNATRTERSPGSLLDLIARHGRDRPDALALVADDASITYGELVVRVEKAVKELRSAPSRRDEPVGAREFPSVDAVVGALAALVSGSLLSGSSRTDALVIVSEEAAINALHGVIEEVGLGPQDTIAVMPETFERFPLTALFAPMVAGATAVALPRDASGEVVSGLIRGGQVTFMAARPPEWKRVVSSWRRVPRRVRALSLGAPLSRELADDLLAGASVLWNGYAIAETSECCTLGRVYQDEPVTAGRPIGNCQAHIEDAHRLSVPPGGWGELVISGRSVASGYATREDSTTVESGPGPDRRCRTGDRARWRYDGRLEIGAS